MNAQVIPIAAPAAGNEGRLARIMKFDQRAAIEAEWREAAYAFLAAALRGADKTPLQDRARRLFAARERMDGVRRG